MIEHIKAKSDFNYTELINMGTISRIASNMQLINSVLPNVISSSHNDVALHDLLRATETFIDSLNNYIDYVNEYHEG